jgi:glutamine synthetase
MLVGFEVEVTFCSKLPKRPGQEATYGPLDSNHAWGTLSDEQVKRAFELMIKIATRLQEMGIELQQLHSEAGAGQYEFVLAPLPPVEAVDTLVQACQCIQHMAAGRNYRATFHPMPFPGIGTAAHAHISLNSKSISDDALAKLENSFVAAVLQHLSALCAFTMPQAASYGRVVDDSWTGGTYVAWGTQNREVPLRKVKATGAGKGSRWEVRCLDGMANMYLALGAILAAGLDGVRRGAELTIKDCTCNPTRLSDAEKAELGIVQRMPTSIEQAVKSLEDDEELAAALAPGLANHYIVMKKAEQEMLNTMTEEERKVWLIERY